ncbi:MAG: Asp/Glu racemase, partial [Pseudomonadota bacterium]
MTALPYDLSPQPSPRLGLVVLQSDETIEQEFRRLIPAEAALSVSRAASGLEVGEESLRDAASHVAGAASLLPRSGPFDVAAFACTSAAAVVGRSEVDASLRAGVEAKATTDPVEALTAACRSLGLRRLAFLSPYAPAVSERLRSVLAADAIETPVFGSFDEPEEAKVARIDPASVLEAGAALASEGGVDAVFLSCTNLRTLDVVATLEARTGLPALSSNLVLAWRMLRLAGATGPLDGPGRLLAV